MKGENKKCNFETCNYIIYKCVCTKNDLFLAARNKGIEVRFISSTTTCWYNDKIDFVVSNFQMIRFFHFFYIQ